jgi:2-methylisocitrate lyase-like PEP mutase family enzyme
MKPTLPTAEQLRLDWANNPRWAGIARNYTAEDVVRLRGTVAVEHSLAKLGAEKLWKSLQHEEFVNALGALTGNQAMQQVKAGLKAIYLSGWQVAADANLAGEMYPDQSLYPANSVPQVVKRINNALLRADQLHHAEGDDGIDFLQPIVADAEAGFGGVLNAFELMKAMIEAGAAGVHFEDQLASVKKCGHMGGKVLVPTREAVEKLNAARLAADVMGVPTLVVARTDAEAADLLTSDIDANDRPFCTGERTVEGFYKTRKGLAQAISRGLAYAPYADLVWCETGKPDRVRARLRRGDPRPLPGQAAGLQLLALVQLEAAPRRRDHRRVPEGTRGHGLQVPVHHPGGLPRAQLLDVPPRPRLRAPPDERLRRTAGIRIRRGREGLHRGQAPARGRHRLLRRGDPGHPGRRLFHRRAEGLHRGGAVPGSARGRLSGFAGAPTRPGGDAMLAGLGGPGRWMKAGAVRSRPCRSCAGRTAWSWTRR